MDDIVAPFLSPGCFGSAIHFQKKSMVCKACPFKAECESVHEITLAAMRKSLGITAPEKKAIKIVVPLAEGEDPGRLTLPVKVRTLLSKVDRMNLDIVGSLQRGVNPFKDIKGLRYLMISCHLILRMKTPTRALLTAGLKTSMNWTHGTADAHARIAMQALTHVGAVTDDNGVIIVKRNS